MAASVRRAPLLDRAHESSSLQEIRDAPVAALAGVSEADAEALKSAFSIKTVSDLGRNRYFQAAVALVELSKTGAEELERHERGPRSEAAPPAPLRLPGPRASEAGVRRFTA